VSRCASLDPGARAAEGGAGASFVTTASLGAAAPTAWVRRVFFGGVRAGRLALESAEFFLMVSSIV
jgi:hypothetical protein